MKMIRVTLDLVVEDDAVNYWLYNHDKFRKHFTRHFLHLIDGEKIHKMKTEELDENGKPKIPA